MLNISQLQSRQLKLSQLTRTEVTQTVQAPRAGGRCRGHSRQSKLDSEIPFKSDIRCGCLVSQQLHR